jgi:hypothetical protein
LCCSEYVVVHSRAVVSKAELRPDPDPNPENAAQRRLENLNQVTGIIRKAEIGHQGPKTGR